MTEADVIQPSASIASTGKGIRYVGQHCYAYSGVIAAGGGGWADTEMLNFTSGAGLIECNLFWGCNDAGSSDMFFNFKLNGVTVFLNRHGRTDDAFTVPYKMIIPPFTECIFNLGTASGGDMTLNLTGRVYGAD